MAQRRSFDKDYLKQEFDKLNAIVKRTIALYLIGGGAMAFYGLKVATKDIDIILTNQEDLNSLQAALGATGYKEPNPIVITRPYNEMQTSAILENQDGFRWDLFLNKVCGKLTLSPDMQKRATPTLPRQQTEGFDSLKRGPFPIQRNNHKRRRLG
jgi:hypothetical protein